MLIKYTLEFSAETGGSVSSPGGLYSLGETVTITATPDSDYFFSGWSDGTSTSSLMVLVSSDQTITASFSLIDVIIPAITLVGSPTIELTIGNTFTDPGATATDNIDGDLTSSIITSGTVDASSTGSYTISYSISDATGNSASVTRTIVVGVALSIYFDNKICKCPTATVGDTEVIDGVTYTVVDKTSIKTQVAAADYNLCTTPVTNISELFRNNTSFNSDISFWDTAAVTDMSNMFYKATSFNQNISFWDTSNVSDMNYMIRVATSFNQNLKGWLLIF